VKKHFLPLILAAFSLSCAPLYVDSPALTAAVIGKLTHEATVGPIPDPGVYLSDPWLSFHPDIQDPTVVTNHGIDPARGFITWSTPKAGQDTYNHTVHLAYAMPDPAGGGKYAAFEGWSGVEKGWNGVPAYQFHCVKAGVLPAMPYAAVIQLDSGATPPVAEYIYGADTTNHVFTNVNTYNDINSYMQGFAGFTGYAVGFFRQPELNAGSNYSFWLFRRSDLGGTWHTDYMMGLNTTYGAGAVSERPSHDFPEIGSPDRVLYFHTYGAANRSYAQVRGSGDAWQGWRWDASLVATPLPSGMAPISCLLSTGDLLSVNEGMGRIYDQDGGLVVSFPTGNLRFVSEDYVDGVLRAVFCLPDVDVGGLYFDVYSIPTTSIRDLAP
jgi:hypothetical protein